MNSNKQLTRQEFEQKIKQDLQKTVNELKDSRKRVRYLEAEIRKKKEHIDKYQHKFEEIRKQLVIVQTKVYAGGTV